MKTDAPPPTAKAPAKPLTVGEIVGIANELQAYVGAQLQDCLQAATETGLGFYFEGKSIWLWIVLDPRAPLIVRVFGKPPPRKKTPRPFALFTKSRLVGRRLKSVHADLARGRVLIFAFHRAVGEDATGPCEIEVHLYPSGPNVIARDGTSAVAENKPKEFNLGGDFHIEAGRDWTAIEDAWRTAGEMSTRATRVAADPTDADRARRDWEKYLGKKQNALIKMREDLAKKSTAAYRAAGEWLKNHGSIPASPLDIPVEFRDLIKRDQSFSEGLEDLFGRAKDNARKLDGSRDRIQLMEKEIQAIRNRGASGFLKERDRVKLAGKQNLLARADAKGRKFAVASDIDVYIGKSAGDNLSLLRRAQPFDYWLHLRDQPGAHAIMRRARGRNVTDPEFREAGRWVVEQTLNRKVEKGERHDLLIVECRYVRPIKGDKLGRVHYTNDRVLGLYFD